MSNSNRRCIDPDGVVHYADWTFNKYRPWCMPGDIGTFDRVRRKRAMVTCLLCLHKRRTRGGDGSLL